MEEPKRDLLDQALDVQTREEFIDFLRALATSIRAEDDPGYENLTAAALLDGMLVSFHGSPSWRATWGLPLAHEPTWSEFAVQLVRALTLD